MVDLFLGTDGQWWTMMQCFANGYGQSWLVMVMINEAWQRIIIRESYWWIMVKPNRASAIQSWNNSESRTLVDLGETNAWQLPVIAWFKLVTKSLTISLWITIVGGWQKTLPNKKSDITWYGLSPDTGWSWLRTLLWLLVDNKAYSFLNSSQTRLMIASDACLKVVGSA